MKKPLFLALFAFGTGAFAIYGDTTSAQPDSPSWAERDLIYQRWARQRENPPIDKPATPKPATADALYPYLAGTVWNISDERPDGKVLYTLTFRQDGTFIHSDGRTGVWSPQSPRDLKLWDWDPGALNDDLTQFRAVGTGVIYFGNLQK